MLRFACTEAGGQCAESPPAVIGEAIECCGIGVRILHEVSNIDEEYA